ncbi:MAG: membrane protein insertase YidC [Verrucomicrobiota bacterium]
MDRKSIIVIAACIVTLVLWVTVVIPKFTPPARPLPAGATNGITQIAGPVSTSSVPVLTVAPTNVPKLAVSAKTPEELLVVTNENARYVFTSHGGGLKEIELVQYPEKVQQKTKATSSNTVATLNAKVSMPVLALLGDASVQTDASFTLSRTATGVRAEQLLPSGLRIVKDFTIGTNYLLQARVGLENTSGAPLTIAAQQWSIGTPTPMDPDDNGEALGFMWYNGAKMQEITPAWFENRTLGCFPGTPRPHYEAGTSNVVWAAVHNQFFALIAMPGDAAQQIVSDIVTLPRPAEGRYSFSNTPPMKSYETKLVYPSVTLAAGGKLERNFNFFAGPKEYQTLARIADQFKNNVDLVMGFGGFFGFFAKALLLGMNWLHSIFSLPYAWAIIAITVIIKILFWPLTQASTRSMKRMQALQPQMKAIQEKYKDDPVKMNKKVMEFYKENKVSPLGGCLPMLLQMPVFFGFVFMVRTAIELRGSTFFWISDLSKPDTLFIIPGLDFIPVIGVPGIGLPFNLLPLLMGATMLWQAKLTPPSPGVDPAQQKMMQYMPLMFMVFFYNNSAGLALYWTVSNLLTILQTKLTKTEPVAAVVSAPTKKAK